MVEQRSPEYETGIGASSPSVTPGPGAPDPSIKLVLASAAAGGVLSLVGYALIRRWFKRRFR